MIGTVQQVMIEGANSDTGEFQGRTQAHAPEVDGVVYVQWGREEKVSPQPGDMVSVTITDASDYDLISEISNG